jgi:hypothetical protein
VEFCLLHHGVLRGKFRWNLQLHLPPRVEFTPCFLAGNTMKCSSKPVVFPYFTTRKYHPSGILGTTHWWVRDEHLNRLNKCVMARAPTYACTVCP